MYEVEGRGRVEKSQKYFYLNSPNNSVMLPVAMPPFSSLSNSLDPVVTWMICEVHLRGGGEPRGHQLHRLQLDLVRLLLGNTFYFTQFLPATQQLLMIFVASSINYFGA